MAIKSANTIPTNKHVLVCGMTGTGKSYLCEQYLSRYDYVVKLDTKDETSERQLEGVSAWEGLEENKDFTIVRNIDLLDDVETKKIIYSPPMIRTMAQMQFGTVKQLVNNMTDEQIDTLINNVEKAIEVVKYGDKVSEHNPDE